MIKSIITLYWIPLMPDIAYASVYYCNAQQKIQEVLEVCMMNRLHLCMSTPIETIDPQMANW